MKFWKKEQKYRYETNIKGVETIGIGDYGENKIYHYMPTQNIAVKIDTSGQEEKKSGKRNDPVKLVETELDNKPTISREEIVNGNECKIVEFTNDGDDYKLWVGIEKGMIWKYEINTNDGLFKMTVNKAEFNKEIPNSKFKLPEGVQIQQIPSIPNQ